MRKVYKYPLVLDDEFTLALPAGAQPLSYGFQAGKPVLWVLVDPDETRIVNRRFLLAGTGHPIERAVNRLLYVNTAFVRDLVFHLFEVLS